MIRSLLTALFIFVLPVVIFVGGAILLEIVSGRGAIPKPKSGRLGLQPTGYGTERIKTYWQEMKDSGDRDLQAEKRFLQLDLLFAPLYCSAIAFSLYLAWMNLGARFSLWWLLLPIVIALLADWTENLIQLDQLANFTSVPPAAVDDGYIRIASKATIIKLVGVVASTILLLVMLVMSTIPDTSRSS